MPPGPGPDQLRPLDRSLQSGDGGPARLGLEPVPALVYRAGKHLISLIEMPSESATAAPVTRRMDRGYETVSWTDNRITYWAVSDASDEEMQAFVKALRSAISPS